jgi:SAM-dependent methyltransferase
MIRNNTLFLHVIYDNELSKMGMVFDFFGQLLYVIDRNQIELLKNNNLKHKDTTFYLIDPNEKSDFVHAWEIKSINNFNSYFDKVFKKNSPLIDSYAFFSKYIAKYIENFNSQEFGIDLGSGNCLYGENHSLKIINCELSLQSLQNQSFHHTHILNVNCDSCNIPFKKSTISFVMCNFLLEHVSSPYRLIEQVAIMLKPKGEFLITIPSLNLLNSIRYFMFRKQLSLPIFHMRSFGIVSKGWCVSIYKIIEKLKAFNFDIIKVEAIQIFESNNYLTRIINKRLNSIFPFKYFGSQTIIIAKKK